MNEREREMTQAEALAAMRRSFERSSPKGQEWHKDEYSDFVYMAWRYVDELEYVLKQTQEALAPFAAVGAQVAAIHAARPQSSYAPEHAALTIGGASITFADLQAAAAVAGVTAQAVTGGGVGTGISEIMEDAK